MNNILQGHVLDVLKTLPADSVDCVVTSPPYWGLRDYKIEPQVWDAVEGCQHQHSEMEGDEWPLCSVCGYRHEVGGKCLISDEHEWGEESVLIKAGNTDETWSEKQSSNAGSERKIAQGSFCLRCGAWRGSLGLEPTPELFVKHIVQVFREVRRVLKPSGVCFVNLGDSYWNGGVIKRDGGHGFVDGGKIKLKAAEGDLLQDQSTTGLGLKPKDLCGIPWRVAFALQADGWWLRSDIIWSKPNPMPESVTDRPTKSHEYIFLLTKSAKYFWNQEAVREKTSGNDVVTWKDRKANGEPMRRGMRDSSFGKDPHLGTNPSGHNIRSVWTFATEPTPEAHFATFPQELVRRCILAGCPDDGTVLDPFMGSGTTGIVAENLYRQWVGIELNPEYIEIAEKRLRTKANIDQVNWLKNSPSP